MSKPYSEKTYSGFVVDVSDGEAMILLDVAFDADGHLDWPKIYAERDGENPDQITLTAERWMQTGTRLNISISRHPDDEPVLAIRDRA